MSPPDFEQEEDREQLEQRILSMLATLEPLSITMHRTKDGYDWICGVRRGNSPPDFVTALKDALNATMEQLQPTIKPIHTLDRL